MMKPGEAAPIYARQFYDTLKERSTLELINDEAGTETLVFRGSLTDAFRDMRISQTYYTKIRNILMEYGCITYLQRGTRAYESVVVLNHAPPEEISAEVLTRPSDPATLSSLADRMEQMEHSVKVLEKWRETTGGIHIIEAFSQMEKRLARLESSKDNKVRTITGG